MPDFTFGAGDEIRLTPYCRAVPTFTASKVADRVISHILFTNFRKMADISTTLPLEADSVAKAYEKIRDHVHRTPLLTNKTIDNIASTSRDGNPAPGFNLFFKCENYQRIGAFKARGAFHAVTHLIEEMGLEEVRNRGVVTHSSGTSPDILIEYNKLTAR
jgi:threonine dehydratase